MSESYSVMFRFMDVNATILRTSSMECIESDIEYRGWLWWEKPIPVIRVTMMDGAFYTMEYRPSEFTACNHDYNSLQEFLNTHRK